MENGNFATTISEAPTTSERTQPYLYPDSGKIAGIVADVMVELHQAMSNHGNMVNLHEAYGVIAEEFVEFQEEVFKNPRKHPRRNELARAELIQLAAMAIRALHDVV